MRPIIMVTAAALLIGCSGDENTANDFVAAGEQDTAAKTSSSAGERGINVRVVGTESISQAGGMFRSCSISFEVDNRLKKAARSLSIRYRPAVPDSADRAVINASGDMTFYFRDLKRGKTDHTSTVKGVDCDAISGLSVKEYFCSLQDAACPANVLTLNGEGIFDVQMPPS